MEQCVYATYLDRILNTTKVLLKVLKKNRIIDAYDVII